MNAYNVDIMNIGANTKASKNSTKSTGSSKDDSFNNLLKKEITSGKKAEDTKEGLNQKQNTTKTDKEASNLREESKKVETKVNERSNTSKEEKVNEEAVALVANLGNVLIPNEEQGNLANTEITAKEGDNISQLALNITNASDLIAYKNGSIDSKIVGEEISGKLESLQIDSSAGLEKKPVQATVETSVQGRIVDMTDKPKEGKIISNEVSENVVLTENIGDEKAEKNDGLGLEAMLQTKQTTSLGEVIAVKVGDLNNLNSQNVINDIADKIVKTNLNEFEMQLEPGNLGKLVIKLVMDKGEARVSILCTNNKTMEILSGQSGSLATALEDRTGLTTTIQIKNQEDSVYDFNFNDQRRQNQQNQEQKKEEKDKKEDSTDFIHQLRLGLI